jgi:glucose-1-phosphate thymidylyltransferase
VFNDEAVGFTKSLKKSDRSEYEITDLNKIYLENKKLKVVLLDNTFSWLDTGTHESLLEASNFVRNIEFKNEISVGDLEVL